MKYNLLAKAVLVALVSTSTTALAQDSIERIEVTGSHIKRADMEGPSPITSISAEDIKNSGVTDLISLFAKLPISGQGTFSTQGNSSDDTANGGSSVSLRGLGADKTLILLNGRRVAVSPFAKGIDTAFVDVSNIPISAIKRIDILKDGASATYGSDAIAGVINVVLRDDVDAPEVTARYGETADGGGEETNLSFVWGMNNDSGSHTIVFDYFNREEVLYGDRDYAKSANQQALRPGDPRAVDFRSSSGVTGSIRVDASKLTDDEFAAIPVEWSGLVADRFGAEQCDPADITGGDIASVCRYDYAPLGSMVPSNERFSVNYIGNQDLTNDIRAFGEFNFQNSKTSVRGAGSPSFEELTMDADNPNHPFADDPSNPLHNLPLTMRRRLVEIGNRHKKIDTDYSRFVLGLEGEFSEWSWETAYSYIKSESTERGVDGFPNTRRVQEAIDRATVKGDPNAFDPFEPSQSNQQTLDYMETTTVRNGKSTMKNIDAKVSGPILEMDHGDLMLAVGAEYREETIEDNPDDQFLRGEVFGTEATVAQGDRDNTSVFAELAIPLLEGMEIQLAVRHEDYSDFGTTTDPKVAVFYNPSEQWVFRGSWGTAFRAPSLHQLGLGRTDESPNLVDTVRCDAVALDCDPREYTATFEGNPELGPEESENFNLGVIWSPTDDLSFGVDYYDYDIENVIDSDTQFVLSAQGTDPNIVPRRPSNIAGDPGEVVTIYDTFINIGDITTSGIDFDASYSMATEYGDFNFNYVLNYVLDYEEVRPGIDGGPERVFITEGEFEQPEFRWTLMNSWQIDEWNSTLTFNYIDEFKGDEGAGFGDETIDSWLTVDWVVNYTGIENTTLTIGSTNLLNEEPPYSHHDYYGFVQSIHSGQGRFVYAQAKYTF